MHQPMPAITVHTVNLLETSRGQLVRQLLYEVLHCGVVREVLKGFLSLGAIIISVAVE